MKTPSRIIAFAIVAVLLFSNVPSALALPPLPSSFYGTVKVNNANVPVGTPIAALINGVPYATANAFLYNGDTVYTLTVPGDDPETQGVIEGGVTGNIIVFRIGTRTTANETAPWQSGTNVERNLTASPTAIHVQGLSARTGGGIGDRMGSLLALGALGLGGVAMLWLGRRR
jgi:hypothetical protein